MVWGQLGKGAKETPPGTGASCKGDGLLNKLCWHKPNLFLLNIRPGGGKVSGRLVYFLTKA